jgi:glycosyltransferase involved in cell wall biosynthesis
MDTLQAAQYLQRNHEVLLITGGGDRDEFEAAYLTEYLPRIRKERINGFSGNISLVRDVRALFKIKEVLRRFKPDIVHTHTAKAGLLGRLAARLEKVPVIVHTYHGLIFHSYYGALKSRWVVKAEQWLAKYTTCIVALSEKQKDLIANTYRVCPAEKIAVVPLGIDLSAFRTNMDQKRREFREKYLLNTTEVAVGIVGRVVPVKNHSFFLKVVALLAKQGVHARYFVIGDGQLRRKLMNECVLLGLDHTFFPEDPRVATITFTSWITEVDKAMAGLDIIALSSYNEGTPVSLMEAQAAGKPVVSTQAGGIEDIMREGETGFCTPQGDLTAYCSALEYLINHSPTRLKFGEAGKAFAAEMFRKERQVNDLNALYEGLFKP